MNRELLTGLGLALLLLAAIVAVVLARQMVELTGWSLDVVIAAELIMVLLTIAGTMAFIDRWGKRHGR